MASPARLTLLAAAFAAMGMFAVPSVQAMTAVAQPHLVKVDIPSTASAETVGYRRGYRGYRGGYRGYRGGYRGYRGYRRGYGYRRPYNRYYGGYARNYYRPYYRPYYGYGYGNPYGYGYGYGYPYPYYRRPIVSFGFGVGPFFGVGW